MRLLILSLEAATTTVMFILLLLCLLLLLRLFCYCCALSLCFHATGRQAFSYRKVDHFSSVRSHDRLSRRGDMGHDSAEILFQSFFRRRPLWTVLAWAGMPTLWCCPSSISSADHGVAHPPRCCEGWFWRGCRGVWHARTMQVSVSWQSPEEVPVDPTRKLILLRTQSLVLCSR